MEFVILLLIEAPANIYIASPAGLWFGFHVDFPFFGGRGWFLVRFAYGFHLGLQLCFLCCPTVFMGFQLGFPWFFHGFQVSFQLGFPMGLLVKLRQVPALCRCAFVSHLDGFQQVFRYFAVRFWVRFSYGFYSFSMVFEGFQFVFQLMGTFLGYQTPESNKSLCLYYVVFACICYLLQPEA